MRMVKIRAIRMAFLCTKDVCLLYPSTSGILELYREPLEFAKFHRDKSFFSFMLFAASCNSYRRIEEMNPAAKFAYTPGV